MTIRNDKWRLMETKEHLSYALEELDLAYNKGMINKLEYLDKRYKLLGGRQEESLIEDINYELREIRNKQSARSKLAMGVFLLVLLIGTGMFTGFFNINFGDFGFTSPTGFATASTPLAPVTMNIGENYTDNTTKDLSFISATSLQASGKIYGSGQAWIYLDDGVTRKLVLYADTRSSIGITGFAIANPGNSGNAGTGFTLVNNTNITFNTEVTGNNTNVSTVSPTVLGTPLNGTNSTVPVNTSDNSSASTLTGAGVVNNTNSTVNVTVNNTNSTNATNIQVLTDKSVYDIGETVQITVLPANSQSNVYINTPTNTYFLNQPTWDIFETGTHTLSALVTSGSTINRASTSFYVTGPLDQQTGTFTNSCVETCSILETPIKLIIVVEGTKVELDSITYVPVVQQSNGTNQTNNNATTPVQIIKSPTQHLS